VGEIHAEHCPWFVELLAVRMDGRLFLNGLKFTIKPTDNPSAQHKLLRISTTTCFGNTNSRRRAVKKEIRSVDTTAECSKGSQTLQRIYT